MPFDPERLRRIMRERGVTHQQLADAVGTSRPSISRLVSPSDKYRSPSADFLQRISSSLGKNVEDVMSPVRPKKKAMSSVDS